MEIDLEDLAHKVFIKNPEPPNSFDLSFDAFDFKNLFEMLLTFFVEGLKKLYKNKNNKVNLSLLTKENLIHIKKCMLSIGIEVIIDIYNINTWMLIHEQTFKKYDEILINNNTCLKDLKVVFFSGNQAYKILFNNKI